MDTFAPILEQALSRRRFVTGACSVAAAGALAGCGDNGNSSTLPSPTSYTDNDILNFALNLEYLEAEFYLRAATGAGLSSADTGGSSATVTAPSTTRVTAPNTFTANLLNELAYTEQQHVRFLRNQLGSAAVQRPAIDFVNSFNTIASLAGIGSSFNPFQNFDSFITAAAIFEDVGVTAYNGAAPLISAAGVKAGLLAAAAGIMSVEAYHGASLRGYITNQAITQGTTAYPFFTYFNQIQAVVSKLSSNYGTTNLTAASATPTATVPSTVAPSAVVPADSNALAFHRSTDQVLHIVYGSLSSTSGATTSAAGVSQGGFFPSGVNGNIKVTQS